MRKSERSRAQIYLYERIQMNIHNQRDIDGEHTHERDFIDSMVIALLYKWFMALLFSIFDGATYQMREFPW